VTTINISRLIAFEAVTGDYLLQVSRDGKSIFRQPYVFRDEADAVDESFTDPQKLSKRLGEEIQPGTKIFYTLEAADIRSLVQQSDMEEVTSSLPSPSFAKLAYAFRSAKHNIVSLVLDKPARKDRYGVLLVYGLLNPITRTVRTVASKKIKTTGNIECAFNEAQAWLVQVCEVIDRMSPVDKMIYSRILIDDDPEEGPDCEGCEFRPICGMEGDCGKGEEEEEGEEEGDWFDQLFPRA